MVNSDWVVLTNKILDNGCELMLVDSVFKKNKPRDRWRERIKVVCVVIFYGIKMLS